ncbi:MAG: hypothetical protein AAF196_11540 [Planctomycetota bacterium]
MGDAPGTGGGQRHGTEGVALSTAPRRVRVQNTSSSTRTETILASFPFAEGERFNLEGLAVAGHETAWLPLQTWSDGSVRVAQAQWTAELGPHEDATFDLADNASSTFDSFTANDWVNASSLSAQVTVRDNANCKYTASVALRSGRVVHETAMTRVHHQRVFHQPAESGCIPRDYLASHFYVQEFRDMPFVVVDWVFSNDYLGVDNPNGSTNPDHYPLGGVDVNVARIDFAGATEVRGYLPDLNQIDSVSTGPNFDFGFRVMQSTWIDDGQTRRYRFHVRVEPLNVEASVANAWQQTFDARVEDPLFPLATIDSWQVTDSLGVHGGPIDGPSDAQSRADRDFTRWRDRDHFGTWGTFGDVSYTGQSGTPRNAPLSPEVAHAVQAQHPGLSQILEQKAWVQATRKYHTYGLEVGAAQNIYLYFPMAVTPVDNDITDQSLGRRAIWDNDPYPQLRSRVDHRAHGMNGYDINHWTTDLLFDYWTVSGDAWAKEEIRLLGECIKGMMRLHRYQTINISNARAEGWTMFGFVQAYLATGDESLKDYAIRRIDEIIIPQRLSDHPSRAIRAQRPDPRSGFGPTVWFYPIWEHASVAYGMLGAYRHFDCEQALPIAEDVVRAIDHSWLSDYTHPHTGVHYEQAIRYWTPLRDGANWIEPDSLDQTIGAYIPSQPLGSTNSMLVSAVDLVSRFTNNLFIRERADFQLSHLYPHPGPNNSRRWNKWYTVVPRYYSVNSSDL